MPNNDSGHTCSLLKIYTPVSGSCSHCDAPTTRYYCEACTSLHSRGLVDLNAPPPTIACRVCGHEFFTTS